ncbi:MAG: nitrogenase cofactor biosynthesis protein NifB [Halanaerobium sp.]
MTSLINSFRKEETSTETSTKIKTQIDAKTKKHPCYSQFAHNYARIHIPVAASCNISCNYCDRKYDCLHETRPGVSSSLLSPTEALASFKKIKEKMDNLTVVGVAGPGDALASFDAVRKSLQLIKKDSPEQTFCLSTNGLALPAYQEELVELGVSHVTITINAVDPKIGAQIYEKVNYQGQSLSGTAGAEILLKNQLQGLKYLSDRGIMVKVNIVLIKGINDQHLKEVVQTVKEAGAFMTNIMPLIPVEGTAFADFPLTSNKELDQIRKKAEVDLKQMYHCQQCRADAVGCLNKDRSREFNRESAKKVKMSKSELDIESNSGSEILKGSYFLEEKEMLLAVASEKGQIVNLHFGHAESFYIYRVKGNSIKFLEKRNVGQYCLDKSCNDPEQRLEKIINTIADCEAVLSVRIGTRPRRKLAQNNIQAVMVYDRIKPAVRYALEKIDSAKTAGAEII